MINHSRTYEELAHFIENEMRMSHVYQPVMLKALLRQRGAASAKEVARALLAEDRAQVEYYEQITKNMVGRVLTKNRGITSKEGETYHLKGFSILSKSEIDDLIKLCDAKIVEYLDKRSDPWSHRRKSTGYVPGTQRYEVLKRAHYRCELCGVSAEHKALEVDHIIPRNNGGSDDTSNLQALCYSCNATKRDGDDTDFRGMAQSYEDRDKNCVFCNLEPERVIAENHLSVAVLDRYAVTSHHMLIIPKRHVAGYFDLHQPEINAVHRLLLEMKEQIRRDDDQVTSFNVGVNVGEDAGQTIMHVHMHLIPRRYGDVENPRGGIRGVIPGKQQY
jgi:ATP adenylyltransferase